MVEQPINRIYEPTLSGALFKAENRGHAHLASSSELLEMMFRTDLDTRVWQHGYYAQTEIHRQSQGYLIFHGPGVLDFRVINEAYRKGKVSEGIAHLDPKIVASVVEHADDVVMSYDGFIRRQSVLPQNYGVLISDNAQREAVIKEVMVVLSGGESQFEKLLRAGQRKVRQRKEMDTDPFPFYSSRFEYLSKPGDAGLVHLSSAYGFICANPRVRNPIRMVSVAGDGRELPIEVDKQAITTELKKNLPELLNEHLGEPAYASSLIFGVMREVATRHKMRTPNWQKTREFARDNGFTVTPEEMLIVSKTGYFIPESKVPVLLTGLGVPSELQGQIVTALRTEYGPQI